MLNIILHEWKEKTYHNHHAFTEPPFWNKNPEDIIHKGAAEKNNSNLFYIKFQWPNTVIRDGSSITAAMKCFSLHLIGLDCSIFNILKLCLLGAKFFKHIVRIYTMEKKDIQKGNWYYLKIWNPDDLKNCDYQRDSLLARKMQHYLISTNVSSLDKRH